MQIKTKPYRYQAEGVRSIEQHGGNVLLADEMGLGKTAQVLWSLARNPDWFPALVVCPASLKFNWEYESMLHIDYRPSVCEGTKPPTGGFSSIPKITVINHDILSHWVPYFKRIGIKTIVADEAQSFKNPKAKRSKALRELVVGAERFMALSGTPLTNRPAELWNILNLIWPHQYPNFWSYAQQYCAPRYKWYGWDYSGASNLSELHGDLVDAGMIRRLKSDVLTDLPDKVRRVVPLELSDYSEYAEARDNFAFWLKKNHTERFSKSIKAEKLVKIGYLIRLCAKLKFKGVVDWVNLFLEDTDDKLVVFCRHRKAIELLKEHCDTKSVVVDGSVTGRDRQLAVEQFQKDEATRLFIGNQAAYYGLTLTAASTVAIAEMPFVPADLTQAEDRCHRIGQRKTAFINYLVAVNTIEERLCEILQDKQCVVSSVLDGGSVPGDLDVYDELISAIEEESHAQTV